MYTEVAIVGSSGPCSPRFAQAASCASRHIAEQVTIATGRKGVHRLRRLFVISLTSAFSWLALYAGAAHADVRQLHATDPQDATPTVSGQPNNPDVAGLAAVYDSAGTLTLTVSFFNDPTSTDHSQNYAAYGSFSIGKINGAGSTASCSTAVPGGLNGQHHVYGSYGAFYDRATVGGMDGYLNFARTGSGTTVTITATSPALAGRDYQCASYQLRGQRYSTAGNLDSRYDSGCDCWYLATVLDVVAPRSQYDSLGLVLFDGFAIPPSPACSDGVDNDGNGKTDYPSDIYSCSSAADNDESSPQCANGKDDDGNGDTDLADLYACSSATDPDETAPQCSNGKDDDGNGDTDWPSDSGCASGSDTAEAHAACDNGKDDDHDGLRDLKDPGCRNNKSSNNEADPKPVKAKFTLKARVPRKHCEIETAVTALPDIKPVGLFPFKKVSITVKGRGYHKTRRLPLAEDNGYVFKVRRNGTYRVSGYYPGDKWRSRSVTRTRTVHVRDCAR